jgi:hypothetical protein
VYARALEDKVGGDQMSYQYARALLKSGQREKALAQFEKLATSSERDPAAAKQNDFWKKLATETLADEKVKK